MGEKEVAGNSIRSKGCPVDGGRAEGGEDGI